MEGELFLRRMCASVDHHANHNITTVRSHVDSIPIPPCSPAAPNTGHTVPFQLPQIEPFLDSLLLSLKTTMQLADNMALQGPTRSLQTMAG